MTATPTGTRQTKTAEGSYIRHSAEFVEAYDEMEERIGKKAKETQDLLQEIQELILEARDKGFDDLTPSLDHRYSVPNAIMAMGYMIPFWMRSRKRGRRA